MPGPDVIDPPAGNPPAPPAPPKGPVAKPAKSKAGWYRLSVVDDPADGTVPRKKTDGTVQHVPVRAPREYYSVFGRVFQRETYRVYPGEVDDQGHTRRDRQRGALVLLNEGEADRILEEVSKRRFVEWVSKKTNRADVRVIARKREPDPTTKEGFRIVEADEQLPQPGWKPMAAYLRIEWAGAERPE